MWSIWPSIRITIIAYSEELYTDIWSLPHRSDHHSKCANSNDILIQLDGVDIFILLQRIAL